MFHFVISFLAFLWFYLLFSLLFVYLVFSSTCTSRLCSYSLCCVIAIALSCVTCLHLTHYCTWPKAGPGFPTSYVICCVQWVQLRRYVIIRFVLIFVELLTINWKKCCFVYSYSPINYYRGKKNLYKGKRSIALEKWICRNGHSVRNDDRRMFVTYLEQYNLAWPFIVVYCFTFCPWFDWIIFAWYSLVLRTIRTALTF